MQHTFDYARVSASDQNLDTQLEDLTQAGCSRISPTEVFGDGDSKAESATQAE